MKVIFYVILLAGAGNTILRLEMENPFTLYRMIAPIGFLLVFILRPILVLKGMGLFLVFCLYNFLLARAYSTDLSQLLPSIVHYFYLFILLMLIIYMKWRYADFGRSFLGFLNAFYVFLFLNLLFEFFFGSPYPNQYVEERALRAFYWNENDLAVVLCMLGWFALSYDRYRGWLRALIIALIIAVLYYNDSKAALISLLFVSIPISLIFLMCRARKVSAGVWRALFGSAALVSVGALVLIGNAEITFATEEYTVNDLLIHPIMNMLMLEPSGETWGSLNNRTDAAIFVIIEYLKSFGLGLGAGGSWLVLSLPQYELGGAQSPHNALLQFIVDFGYPVLIGYFYAALWAVRKLFSRSPGSHTRLKVMAILSFPLLGLSQSGAIVTNYMFFAVVFYICLLDREFGTAHRRSGSTTATGHRVASRSRLRHSAVTE